MYKPLAGNLNAGGNGWSYDADNHLTYAPAVGGLPGASGLSYDTEGNLTGIDGKTLSYNALGQLDLVAVPGSGGTGTVTITYDPAGRRFTSTDPSGVTTYSDYDGNQLIGQQNGSGTGSTYTDIVDANGTTLGSIGNSGAQYLGYDPLGNIDSSWAGNGTLQDLLNNQRNAMRQLAEGPSSNGPVGVGVGGITGNGLSYNPTTGLNTRLNNGGRYSSPPGLSDDDNDGIGDYRNAVGNFWGGVNKLSGYGKAALMMAANANPLYNINTALTGKNPDGSRATKLDKGMAWAGILGGGLGALGHDAEIMGNMRRGGCFPAGTKVAVKRADSTTAKTSTLQGAAEIVDEKQVVCIPIEQVKEGDTVVSRDEATGKTQYKRVVHPFSLTSDHLIALTFADSKTGNIVETIQTTRNHPFYVDSKGWTPAGGLAIGNSIVTRAGPTLVIKDIVWERRAEGYKVYNFEVEDTHSYFVGTADGGAWVHNSGNCFEGDSPAILGRIRRYNEPRIPGYDQHHLDPPLGRHSPEYSTDWIIDVRNDNAGGKVEGGMNYHTAKDAVQASHRAHYRELGYTTAQYNALSYEERQVLLRRYYASLGIMYPK